MRLIQGSFLVFVAVLVLSAGVVAQTLDSDDATFDRRLELAERMQALNPAKDQVESAIDKYVENVPPKDREVYRAALRNVLNYRALEKISIDAYAETFTEAELAAMVEYYSKPEAISARDKHEEWGKKVYPEIIRMMDKAMMRVKTGGTEP